MDEVDIDLGPILRKEKKAQTIKLRNISKILDDQMSGTNDLPIGTEGNYDLDEDIHVTSGCGVITMTIQSEKPDAPA